MGARRKFSVEYKREAVGMLDAPGVTVSQIAAELGIGVNVLGRWRRELRHRPHQAFIGNGRSRDEELSQLRRELARVTKERDFCEKRQRSSRERRHEVSDDPTMPRHLSHPIDVSLFTGIDQWVLRLGDAPAQCTCDGECPGWCGAYVTCTASTMV